MKETGLSRVSKNIVIGEIEKQIKSHPAFFVTQYGAVPAAGLDKLRARLRQARSRVLVVKNSLGRRAFEKTAFKDFSESLLGSCGIVFSGDDPVLSSKILMEFSKENESFKVQSALVNGQKLGPAEVKFMAALPPREVLVARAVWGLKAPISRLVGVLAGTVRQVVTVLDAIAKKKGEKP